MYRPRVVGIVVNQKILIRNSGPVMHNIHSYAGTATVFNQAQPQKAKDMEKSFSTVGVTKLKCDVHPWMTGWAMVNDNPYLCVTGDTGECTISNLPAGTYTFESWHEKYGTKTVDVMVGAGETKSVDLSYAAQ